MKNGLAFLAVGGLLCMLSSIGMDWLTPVGYAICLGLGGGLGVVGMRRVLAVASYWGRCSRVCDMLKEDFERALGEERVEDAATLHRRMGRVLKIWRTSIDEKRVVEQDPEDL